MNGREIDHSFFNAYSSEKLDYYLNKLPDDIRNRLVNCKNCNQLSGGEKQVLNILTCALAQKPITIVDEGLSAMDYNTKQIVRKEILSKIKTNIYIEIAHSTEFETIDFFDQLLEMNKGRVTNVYSKHEYLMANFRE
jgi:ABC-type bacteriocin/lantibiotic exporter with double-glycine peptidase domain